MDIPKTLNVEFDNPRHNAEFIQLNEDWIQRYFVLEESDRKLALNPFQIVENGGHLLSLICEGKVRGVCALVRESDHRFQLARLAVDPEEQGKGYGELLVRSAIQKAIQRGASDLYLLTNTKLVPALHLYRKLGFQILSEGNHPVYARCNLVMELSLE